MAAHTGMGYDTLSASDSHHIGAQRAGGPAYSCSAAVGEKAVIPEPFLEIHPSTANAAGIEDGAWMVLEPARGSVTLKAKFEEALHPGVVATQYGWWQGCQELERPGYHPFGPDGANVNLLIANEGIDPISVSVPHRFQRCRVRRAGVSAGPGMRSRS